MHVAQDRDQWWLFGSVQSIRSVQIDVGNTHCNRIEVMSGRELSCAPSSCCLKQRYSACDRWRAVSSQPRALLNYNMKDYDENTGLH
jgi:hypothetical protein